MCCNCTDKEGDVAGREDKKKLDDDKAWGSICTDGLVSVKKKKKAFVERGFCKLRRFLIFEKWLVFLDKHVCVHARLIFCIYGIRVLLPAKQPLEFPFSLSLVLFTIF